MKKLFSLGVLFGCLWAYPVWAQTATVHLSFAANPSATAHKVYRKSGAGAYALIATVSTPTYDDASLPVGVTYCHKSIASNQYGEGPDSNECCSALLLPGADVVSCTISVP